MDKWMDLPSGEVDGLSVRARTCARAVLVFCVCILCVCMFVCLPTRASSLRAPFSLFSNFEPGGWQGSSRLRCCHDEVCGAKARQKLGCRSNTGINTVQFIEYPILLYTKNIRMQNSFLPINLTYWQLNKSTFKIVAKKWQSTVQ